MLQKLWCHPVNHPQQEVAVVGTDPWWKGVDEMGVLPWLGLSGQQGAPQGDGLAGRGSRCSPPQVTGR